MLEISYRRHRFPPVIIQHAVWLYLRFTLSYRDVEELLAERGLHVSYETVRSWVLKFGPIIARRLRCSRPRPSNRWHLDEMVVRIAGAEGRVGHILHDAVRRGERRLNIGKQDSTSRHLIGRVLAELYHCGLDNSRSRPADERAGQSVSP